MNEIAEDEIEKLYQNLKTHAEASGYHLNPDIQFTKDILQGLLRNEKKFGYQSCPCRLGSGDKNKDWDIICPCIYRDPDLNDYDSCYCALYVTQKVLDGQKKPSGIPERRPPPEKRMPPPNQQPFANKTLSKPVWRCGVCGYLCARDEPPDECPICKAKKERFERFI